MAYNAKTDWKYDDNITENDVNRWEQGIADAHEMEVDIDNLQQEFTAHQAETMHQEDETVTVGEGGDFNTINEAITYFSRKTPEHKENGLKAEIKLLSGFVMEEQVFVEGIDLGWVTITSEDEVVIINPDSLTRTYSRDIYDLEYKPAFGAFMNGILPVIGALFDMQYSQEDEKVEGQTGIMVIENSRATVLDSCGVMNAGWNGIHAMGASIVDAHGSIFSGARDNGIFASSGSTVSAINADISNAGSVGVHARDCSIVYARNADISNAGNTGARATGNSIVDCSWADIRNCVENGVVSRFGSLVDASGSNARIKEGEDSSSDYKVEYGGILTITYNATGGTSQTPNEITSNGIIFS